MNAFDWAWLSAGLAFLVLESIGIVRHLRGKDTPDDTLTEWFRRARKRWPVPIAVFWAWLTWHFFFAE